eukprot:snap_masked-scaffold_23-processed-gene-0.32-mRNA-1 protein AED:1.00 eAED:1.00 QI:0/-1/0/0/-1/1/1/0/111
MSAPPNWSQMDAVERADWKKVKLLNRFRMVSNMIRLDRITIPTSLNLPNLERQMLSIKNYKYYITLDVLSGFDFMPNDEASKNVFTLVTMHSAWRMNGSPMGCKNTPAIFF